ncbi:MAG: hypothetical protein RPU34_02205 [Candidatus Sedimenticola sp. (ex Thyasira tokunagai)]
MDQFLIKNGFHYFGKRFHGKQSLTVKINEGISMSDRQSPSSRKQTLKYISHGLAATAITCTGIGLIAWQLIAYFEDPAISSWLWPAVMISSAVAVTCGVLSLYAGTHATLTDPDNDQEQDDEH